MRLFYVILLVLFLIFPAHLSARQVSSTGELARIRSEIESFKQRLATNTTQEKSLLESLQELEYEISLRENLKRELENRENTLTSQMQSNSSILNTLSNDLQLVRHVFRKRAVNMYKYSRSRSKLNFLSADSFQNLPSLLKYYTILAERDRRILVDISMKTDKTKSVSDRLSSDINEQSRLVREVLAEERILQKKLSERQQLLSTLQADNNSMREVLAGRQKAEQDIIATMTAIVEDDRSNVVFSETISGEPFSWTKGKLQYPAEGTIVSHAGIEKNSMKKTQTVNHGIEIVSESDTRVRAVYDGRIAQIKWLPWFGQTVFVQHTEGYYTVYARLSDIVVHPGDIVTPQQLIGKFGGDISSSLNTLHFQIWKGSETLDPEEWFVSSYRGVSGNEDD